MHCSNGLSCNDGPRPEAAVTPLSRPYPDFANGHADILPFWCGPEHSIELWKPSLDFIDTFVSNGGTSWSQGHGRCDIIAHPHRPSCLHIVRPGVIYPILPLKRSRCGEDRIQPSNDYTAASHTP